ncbi:MAG: mechanosensitive ion channel family protein [Polyangia bacterium]
MLSGETARLALRVAAIVLGGLLLAFVLKRRLWRRRAPSQHLLMLRRLIVWAVIAVTVLWAIHEMGVDLAVLLGAAGVLTVAIGFAAQTSASNVISGLFLMTEKPFEIGDVITVEGVTGEVLSVDMISVKLRTFANVLVRVPNELVLKSKVENLTRLPIRRVDMQIGVAYKEDTRLVREILFEVAERNPLCLADPEPVLFFVGYGDSALEFQFSAWAATSNFFELKTSMYEQVKIAFDEKGVEIPFPHVSIYTGEASKPFPVQVESRPA